MSSSSYYFIGTACEIGGRIKLERFGQKVTLDDDVAAECVRGGAALLPESIFDQLGFTADQLNPSKPESVAYPAHREAASEAVKAQVKSARQALHDYRGQIDQESK